VGPVEILRDTSKGERYFQVVDAGTVQALTRVDVGQKLEEAAYPEMESAVRPMALSHDERVVYAQISFHHGFIEYDLEQQRALRVAYLPVSEEAAIRCRRCRQGAELFRNLRAKSPQIAT
jgi:hypothetical protein